MTTETEAPAQPRKRRLKKYFNESIAQPQKITAYDVLMAVEGVRSELKTLRKRESVKAAMGGGSDDEFDDLKDQLVAMAECIDDVKDNLAMIAADDSNRLPSVMNELDAVIAATETATNAILESAENIEKYTHELAASFDDEKRSELVDKIQNETTNLMISCNFQDLTGQRITKIIKAFSFLEERVNAIMELWGRDEIAERIAGVIDNIQETDTREDSHLLNGPQTNGPAVSQDDIDALFD